MKEQGLKREERLHKHFQIERVYKEGRVFSGRIIRLVMLANGLPRKRVGFAVSKKRVRLSTHRNRVKRLLREAYRHNKYRIKQGFDIVLVAHKTPPDLKLQEIEKELLRLAGKAGALISEIK